MIDMRQNLIFLALGGSQAYGLATEKSDLDLKGIAIPPKPVLFGAYQDFEQAENDPTLIEFLNDEDRAIVARCGKKPESAVYSLRKFFRLAADCNPNIIECLWVDERDIRLKRAPFAEALLKNRGLFLSKKAKFTFSGYAFSQIKRINTHRKWLLDPPRRRPERADYGLAEISAPQFDEAEALIRGEVERWAFHDLNLSPEIQYEIRGKIREQLAWTLAALRLGHDAERLVDDDSVRAAAMAKVGFDDNLMDVIRREHQYRRELAHFKQYETWKRERNAERAALEAKFGYDTKHGAHVVRLTRMAREILERGEVHVRRPDREELLAIRRGEWSYERLVEYANEMEAQLGEIYKTSPLAQAPDRLRLDLLCAELTERFILGERA